MIELYILATTTLLGAILFASGMYIGIKVYKHAQEPFVDLTPIETHIDTDTPVEEEGFNWNDYDNYIDTKLKEDIADD